MVITASENNIATLEIGKTYNLVAGIHIGGCGDVIYLSNMTCISANDHGFTLQGVNGSVGSLKDPVFIYKDEIFAIFDRDLYECLVH